MYFAKFYIVGQETGNLICVVLTSCRVSDFKGMGEFSLMNQIAPTVVLGVLHQQHAEGESGHSDTVFETQRNVQPVFAYSILILL